MNARLIAAAAIISTIGFAQHALAQDAGDWIVRAGFHAIAPKSDSHAPIEVKSTTGLTFSATYMTTPNWGVELLGALPFLHGIALEGLGAVGETSVLPPTLSAQYHFNPNGRVRPYAGAGINYTVFSDERTWGALHGMKLELNSSFGAAAQVGIDIEVIPGWSLNVDARWFDIDTDARMGGVDVGTIAMDPYALGVSLGYRF